jgi:eukaryotic-like serine/threonine-protein kinase
MDEERRALVRTIVRLALARSVAERPPFLASACGESAALRAEVDALLSTLDQAPDCTSPETTTVECGDRSSALSLPGLLPCGSRLGPYEIVDLLGRGGMGEVYRARDPRLRRLVAIKLIRDGSGDPELRRRFEHEAHVAGGLAHPNILAVYDVGDQQGRPFVVTELLEGETLRLRICKGAPPLSQAIDFMRQILSGLSAAHEKGVVHRDLKPENLFITADGRLKILDFGIAQSMSVAEDTSSRVTTGAGTIRGTAGYMSPEQVRGERVDARSDLFAFGAVAFELLAGERAFIGISQAEILSALLRDEPPAIPATRSVPAAIEAVVRRCLTKDAGGRLASAREVLRVLDMAVASRLALREATPSNSAPPQRSVAVLPFRDLTREAKVPHLGLGLADATITELARHRTLVVRPTSAILRYETQEVEPLEAGRALGVDAVVDGSFQRSSSRLRVTVQLLATADGRPLWATTIDTTVDDIFRVQDEVSRNIALAFEVELTAGVRRLSPPAGRAYEFYLRGRGYFLRETWEDVMAAADWFEKARETDSNFALSWAGLSDAYAIIAYQFQPEGNWYERATAACEKALTIAPDLPEGLCARARLRWSPRGGWDVAGALHDLLAAISSQPSLDDAYTRTASILYHVGLLPEAVARLEQVLALNPQHLLARSHLACCDYLEGRYEQALERLSEVTREVASPWMLYEAALCEVRLGKLTEAEAIADRLKSGGAPVRALIAALRGQDARARLEIQVNQAQRHAYGDYHHAQYEIACVLSLLDDGSRAIDWLIAAARNGYPCLPLFEKDPFLVSLRGQPRFERFLADLRVRVSEYGRLYHESCATPGAPGIVSHSA